MCNVDQTPQKWNAKDRDLANLLEQQQALVHEALCDNFDTPKAVKELFELVKAVNKYLDA